MSLHLGDTRLRQLLARIRDEEGADRHAREQLLEQQSAPPPTVRFGGVRLGRAALRAAERKAGGPDMAAHTPQVGTFRTPAGQRSRLQEPTQRDLQTSNPFTALEETLAGRTERQQGLQRGEFETQAADPAFTERLTNIEAESRVQAAREQASGVVGAASIRGPSPQPVERPTGTDPRIIAGAQQILSSESSSEEAIEFATEILLKFLMENAPEE